MMFSRRFNSSTAYIISFWAKADTERTQTLCIRNYDDELELLSPTIDLTTEYKKYTYQFYLTSEDLNEEIEFQFRLNQGDTYIKDCYITPMWIEKNGIWEKKADFPQWSIWSDSSCRTYPANWIVLQDMAEDSIKVQRFIGRREDAWNNWKLQFGYEKEIKQAGKYVFSFTDEKGLTGCINLRNSTTDKDVNKYSDLSGLGGNYYIIFDVTEAEVNNMFTLAFWTKDMELTDGIEYIHLSNVKLEKYDSNKTYSGKNLGQKQSLIYFESERGKIFSDSDTMYKYVDIDEKIESLPTPIYSGTDYTFAGWYTDPEFKNPMVYPYTVTKDNLTVYAKWIDVLRLFDNGDIIGGFAPNGMPLTYQGNGIYTATFTYSHETCSDGYTEEGTVKFRFRPVAGEWDISYGPKNEQPTLNGSEVEVGGSGNFEISKVVEGKEYTISLRCTLDNKLFVKVAGEAKQEPVIDETNFISSDSSVTVTKFDTEVMIENPNVATGSEWDYYVTAVQEFDMNANQNYKVSVEVKSDSEKDVIFRLADYLRTESHVQVKKTINTEWQTIEFETGSWTADWLAQFIVYVGTTDVVYLRNLKVEGVNTNLLPVTEYNNSVISERSENGFTVEITNTSEWMKIPGQKAEFGNLYKITFDASATTETTLNFSVKASQGKYADSWNNQTISSTPTNYTLYVPHVGSDISEDYDFMDIGFGSSAASTITISNFTVEIVGSEEKPDVLFALEGITTPWNQFMGYLGSAQNITIPAGESFEVFAQIGVENFDNWNIASELRYVTGAEILDISTNESGRPVITNNTVIDREFKLWIYDDYRIIVEELPTYSVTFDLNDGTFNGSSSNVTLDVSNLLAVKPEKEGYTFVGWTLTENGDDFISSVDSECTVYAKWQDNLSLFANGDIIGDFSVTASETDAETYVYDETVTLNLIYEDNGVYTTTFTYQDYMNGWGSEVGTCAFKLRTSAGSWSGTSYGIADSNNQPIIGGDAVLIDAVQGDNIVVTGLVYGTTYKITVTCSQDGTVTLKVDAL